MICKLMVNNDVARLMIVPRYGHKLGALCLLMADLKMTRIEILIKNH